jgi:hypothetical protein
VLLKNKIKVNVSAIAVVLFVFVLGTSCKKKSESAPPPANNPIINSPYSVSSSTVFSGFFTTVSRVEVNGQYVHITNYSGAQFFTAPISAPHFDSCVKVSNVILNGATSVYDTLFKNYNSSSTNFQTQVWQVIGLGNMPSFNFRNDVTPSCDNFNVIPDSVSKSTGFTFSITGVTNVTTSGYEFQLYEGSNILIDLIKPIYNGNNIITITPAELANVNLSGEGLNIYISLVNVQDLNFYGTDFRFSKGNQFSKRVKICP